MQVRSIAGSLVLFAILGAPAWGQAGTFDISCEGTESTGGGAFRYQYTLRNVGPIPQPLTLFYLGTQDLNLQDYSNWVAPLGFTPNAIVANWPTLTASFPVVSMAATTLTKTPHGLPTPIPPTSSAGGILWVGGITLAPGQTATFGFDNLNPSWDMEWFAEHPGGANVSQGFPMLPIAGPTGVFSNGFVHGPAPPIFITYCDPAANHSGLTYAKIQAFGNTVSPAPVTHLECIDGPVNQFGYFLVSAIVMDPGSPVGSGFLCLGGTIGRYNLVAGGIRNSVGKFDAAGVLQNLSGTSSVGSGFDVPTILPSPPAGVIGAGQTWYFQSWFRDGATSNFSTAIGVTFQ